MTGPQVYDELDPITFSVIWGGLLAAAAEMGVTLTRTAYSVAVREGSDFSTGMFDDEGNMVAQGDYSPGHLGSMAFAVRGFGRGLGGLGRIGFLQRR